MTVKTDVSSLLDALLEGKTKIYRLSQMAALNFPDYKASDTYFNNQVNEINKMGGENGEVEAKLSPKYREWVESLERFLRAKLAFTESRDRIMGYIESKALEGLEPMRNPPPTDFAAIHPLRALEGQNIQPLLIDLQKRAANELVYFWDGKRSNKQILKDVTEAQIIVNFLNPGDVSGDLEIEVPSVRFSMQIPIQ